MNGSLAETPNPKSQTNSKARSEKFKTIGPREHAVVVKPTAHFCSGSLESASFPSQHARGFLARRRDRPEAEAVWALGFEICLGFRVSDFGFGPLQPPSKFPGCGLSTRSR